MAITSNLKSKGYKIEGGTTLIKLPIKEIKDKRRSSLYLQLRTTDDKYKLRKWVKAIIPFDAFKKLKN